MSLIDLKVPSIGESITEVTLSKWLKPDGAVVAIDEALCEFESDKATLEFPSEAAGVLIHVAKEGDDLPIGAIVARIDTSGSPVSNSESKEVNLPVDEKSIGHSHSLSSPVAAKILAESNLKEEQIKGTGRDGKITKADALQAVAQKEKQSDNVQSGKVEPTFLNTNSTSNRNQRREKLSRMRRTIARRLVSAKNETAMLTTFNEVDMSAIIELRNTYNG